MTGSMAIPDATTGQARVRERRLRQPRARSGAPVDRILGRRDVALVPWISMTAGALALALSAWLHGRGGSTDDVVIYGALIGAVIAAGFTAIQDSWLGLRFRGSLWVYLLVAGSLLAALTALAIHDEGLLTPAYAGTLLLASYLGLVFPSKWRRLGLFALLAAGVGVQLANAQASTFDAVMMLGLTVAAWAVGVIGSRAHAWAARVAGALGSYDELTGTLNRRGVLRQVDQLLDSSQLAKGPIALVIIDLDGFKAVNDRLGHAAGDDLLAWVGATVPAVLPPDAEMGRLGGDEFAVILPGVDATTASVIGQDIRAALSSRIGASVGVATTQTRAVTAHDLFRVADAALYVCKRDPAVGTRTLVAGSAGRVERRRRPRPATQGHPPLSFARMRATGFAPSMPESGLAYGWMVNQGTLVVAAAGAYVVVGALLAGGGLGFYHDMLRYLGIPWVASFVLLGMYMRRHEVTVKGARYWAVFWASDFMLAFGVGVAMLANGGLVAPIGGALFLKALFMASIVPRRHARYTVGSMATAMVLVAILGPPSALWVAPYIVAMLGAAFALGSIGYRALDDLTTVAMDQAHTDELTGLRNRSGFHESASHALEAAATGHEPLALLALDLDDFKAINDERGHAAGDAVLREVAAILQDACPGATTIGRLGGDEFVVVAPIDSDLQAAALARNVTKAALGTVGASVGYAVFPDDGTDLDALLLTADRRSYARKRHKPPHPSQGRLADDAAA